MTLADKIALANRIARAVADSSRSLADEITDAGHPELVGDYDLDRLIRERVTWCDDCEEWTMADATCGCEDYNDDY